MMENVNDQSFNERRRFRRFDIPLDILIKCSQESSNYSSGTIRNFSRYGFCFESEKMPIRTDESLEFIVKLPARETFIPVKGSIVWIRNDRDKVQAGISINEIDKGAKCEILDYGYDSWVEEAKSKTAAVTT